MADPIVAFEVISPSTSHVDRIQKLREYGAVETIRAYAKLETDTAAASLYDKQQDGQWVVTVLTNDDVLSLPSLSVDLPLEVLYPRSPA